MAFFPNMGFVVSFYSRHLMIYRKNPGSYVNGYWVEGTVSTISSKGSMQPAKPRDLEILPEGERRIGMYLIFTLVPLYVDGNIESTNSDIILDPNDNSEYRIISASNRSVNGFYRNFGEYQPQP